MTDEDRGGAPPCFAHELRDGQPVDEATLRDVGRFRRAERQRFLDLRRTLSVDESRRQAGCISKALDELLGDAAGHAVAVYWPIRGEPDLRPWMERLQRRGARVALPVVVERGTPLVFREWTPGAKMERGVWNIPVPATGATLVPDIVIAPVLGLDAVGFRLGNGGGYYDRTLAALPSLPFRVGVGHDFARIPTIFPMHWDIPMQAGVFGDGGVDRFE